MATKNHGAESILRVLSLVFGMSSLQNIRTVPRPVNTIVDDSGRDGPKRFAERQRASSKYVPGGNPQPHNSEVIGHRYVPVSSPTASGDADMLSYGAG